MVNRFSQGIVALVEEIKIAAPEIERGSDDTCRHGAEGAAIEVFQQCDFGFSGLEKGQVKTN